MNDEYIVVFKARKDGIIVDIDADAPFAEVLAALKIKLEKASGFFGDAKSAVTFNGREFTDGELDAMLGVFKEQTNLDITYTGNEVQLARKSDKTPRKSAKKLEREPSEEPAGETVPNAVLAANFEEGAGAAKFHSGSLRSGQKIDFAGSVIVWGDVNPGAEITAEGHIVVLGALRGVAHAGFGGDLTKTISAIIMQPTQIRIADTMTRVTRDSYRAARKTPRPMQAYVDGDVIRVEELV